MFTATILLAVVQALGIPVTPIPPVSGPPVQVEDCYTQTEGNLLIASTSFLVIKFTNESSLNANIVRFRVRLPNGSIAYERDAGTFSPGVEIVHRFRHIASGELVSPIVSMFSHGQHTHCAVDWVHFTNGGAWTPSEGIVTVTPTPSPVLGNGDLGIILKQTTFGVEVNLVLPSSPAQNAGLSQGDVIKAIDGQRISTEAEAVEMISASPPGTRLRITVDRNGTKEALVAVVASRPSLSSPPPRS